MKCKNCGVEITDEKSYLFDDDSYLCADCFDELYDLEDEDESGSAYDDPQEDEDKDTIQ